MNEVFEQIGVSKRPVAKTELLDCFALMDALLEAGWITGFYHQYSRPNRRHFPDQHCLVGAARVAAREVAEQAEDLGLQYPLLNAVQSLLMDEVVEVGGVSVASIWKELTINCHHSSLMDFNDRQKTSGPVRDLVQRAAAKIGSK